MMLELNSEIITLQLFFPVILCVLFEAASHDLRVRSHVEVAICMQAARQAVTSFGFNMYIF